MKQMKPILERLNKEWLFCDGGSGTILQKKGLRTGELPESWNLTHPEEIRDLYSGYLNAGCDIFNTNTFGANRLHYPDNLEEVITAGISLAKEARKKCGREDAYIALDIGPTGKLLEPLGDLSFEDAVDIFAEIVRIGAPQGADLILIETMNDTYEVKAALLAAKENCDLPVFVTTTYNSSGLALTGASVKAMIPMLEGLGADAVGVNCSLGPKELYPIVKEITETASKPVIVNPNAGLPKTKLGRTYYDITPQEFTDLMEKIASLGVQVMGGCCGTTPEHIRMMRERVSAMPFQPAARKNRTFVTSCSGYREITDELSIVGERINPTGKKRFKQALKENDLDYIVSQGIAQEEAGAHILDVNVGLPGINEAEMMSNAIQKLQAVITLPLQIDSSDPAVLQKALRIYNGKPMINSVSGKEESIRAVMPLVKKYGGVLVALCLDEEGIPYDSEGRIRIAERILKCADEYGIPRSDIVIDGLVMTVSSDITSAKTTLQTIRTAKEKLHCHTILGVSNVSFGLPQRPVINSYFLAMAMNSGLSAAIINPNDEIMVTGLKAAGALLGNDPQCAEYIDAFANADTVIRTGRKTQTEAQPSDQPPLFRAVMKGLVSEARDSMKKLLEDGSDPMEYVNAQLIPALDEVGKGFEKGTVFLPQLLMSADAAKAAFEVVKQHMQGKEKTVKGRVILATVKGDIHDIGKNIVRVMLENYGYDVLDLGRDVDPEVIAEETVKNEIKLVGLSALMTTTVVSMEETIRLLRKVSPDTKIIVGGAVLTQEYADQIGADAYGKDAMATVRYADTVFSQK